MLKYQLLDFPVIVRRSVIYLIVSAINAGLLIGIVSLIYEYGGVDMLGSTLG